MFGTEQSTPVGFIVQKALDETLGNDSYQLRLTQAGIFVEQRLWYDAIEVYSDLIRDNPSKPDAYKGRGIVYSQLETTKTEAESDLQR